MTANAVSQDDDALFPPVPVDEKAAVTVSIYTTLPAILGGVVLYFVWGPIFMLEFDFGVLGP